MKILFLFVALVIFAASPAVAQTERLETTDELRQRLSSERWQNYESRREKSFGIPSGGMEKGGLGTAAPPGTERPGMTQPYEPYPSGRPWDGGRQRRGR